jgi:ribA/ribD-fused uncharacterized protein
LAKLNTNLLYDSMPKKQANRISKMARSKRQKRNFQVRPPAESAEELAEHQQTDEDQSESSANDAVEQQGTHRFHFFWQNGSPFSQWHPSQYELNGVTYSCAEQGMMHGKALLFEDYGTAKMILNTNKPKTMKELGRKVRFFDEKVWKKNRERIVYQNSVAKFTQNPHLLEALLDNTDEGSLLVEASPYDSIWGIGLNEAAARNTPPKSWKGLNLLGKILTQVRDEIKAGMHDDLIAEAEEEE